jgi:putative oxidoreductase
VFLGRVLYSAIFILASFGHFTAKTIDFAASQGVLFANIFVPFSGLLALIGGLSVFLGYKARYGAWLLVIFLVPVTYMMHKFWIISSPMMHDMQQAMFMKNTALLGAALLITHFGSGPLSLKK